MLADVSTDGNVREALLRLRYDGRVTPWFPWLWVPLDALHKAGANAGLRTYLVATTAYGYVAEIRRDEVGVNEVGVTSGKST